MLQLVCSFITGRTSRPEWNFHFFFIFLRDEYCDLNHLVILCTSCCTFFLHIARVVQNILIFSNTIIIVIYLDFHSIKQALWFVDSWSCAHDQIQMYPDRDTIPQLLPAPDVLLRLVKETSKYITQHLMYGPSGN